ncbi:protein adenylyltransferase SelO family protein, partial [Acinetobacter baumannii]
NTDNMNINGESFDYGPYRFLPFNDPNFVAAYFDHAGLYSFGRQPEAVHWNLHQLAGCLALLGEDPGPFKTALAGFGSAY